jgi:hypothetical protein
MTKRLMLALGLAAGLFAATAARADPPSNTGPLYQLSVVEGRTIYISPDSRSRSGDSADLWAFFAEPAPRTVGSHSVIGAWVHEVFNCSAATVTTEKMVVLDDQLAVAFTGQPDNPSNAVKPGSVEGKAFDYACKDIRGWTGTAFAGVAAASKAARH